MSIIRDKQMTRRIAKEVDKLGGRTFYVGGYVRDKILGKSNKDIDIEIHGIEMNQLKTILENLGEVDDRKVGDNFGIMALKGYDVDIAMPRSEKPDNTKEGGHKDFIIDVDPFIGYENAAKRRDLTINALMEDVLTGEVLDYFGGQDDLKNGIIRHVDSKTYSDDPLRVLRVAQFAARFGFKVADDTVAESEKMDLSKLSRERIAGELSKALLKSDKPSIFFDTLREMNQLSTWFPEVEALIGVKQREDHHPEGDVYNHTMMVLDEAAKLRDKSSNPLYFMVSALCHDFGKPEATAYNEKKQMWQSIDHDKIGVDIAKKFVKRVYHENAMEHYVANMTRYHMTPLRLINNDSSHKKFMHMFDDSICPEDLILIAKADSDGRARELEFDDAEKILREKLADYHELMKQPHVTGEDLKALGYEPGPMFKEMLVYTHNHHLAGISKEESLSNLKGEFRMRKKDSEIRQLPDISESNAETVFEKCV